MFTLGSPILTLTCAMAEGTDQNNTHSKMSPKRIVVLQFEYRDRSEYRG
jgi:hypothetical protein